MEDGHFSDAILSVFDECKDIDYLTLVNLLNNYVPLVLSIYSIVFKCNNFVTVVFVSALER